MPDTVAGLRMSLGETFRRSLTGQPRTPLCGMGICYECRSTVDGVPQSKSCQIPAQPQPAKPLPTQTDILIAGAGPAGLAAAIAAAECGRHVTVLDDNPTAGGQIWRGGSGNIGRATLRRLEAAAIDFHPGATIVSAQGNQVTVETREACAQVAFHQLILATGARELFLPFPGWTLPNVAGAGGLQALVKHGLDVRGKRIVVAGSGPLLLAVAAYLQNAGAHIPVIAEQAPLSKLLRFSLRLTASKLVQAAALQFQLLGATYKTSTWITRAVGDDRLEAVIIRGRRIPCDYLAIGYGLVPNTELAAHLGCAIRNSAVQVDDYQRTTVSNIFCAGECTGIGGVDLSLAEGEIAGFAAAGALDKARANFKTRRAAARFAARLNRAFALRDELHRLPDETTLLCRCEDVPCAAVQDHTSFREAKLQHRLGMGPCQGRVCGPAAEFLYGWQNESIRPPVFPARIETLIGNAPQ